MVSWVAAGASRGVFGVAWFLVTLAGGLAAMAQDTGTVGGVVATGEGQPVVDASVTLIGLGRRTEQVETTTDSTGRFQKAGLTPGHYSVSARKDGLGDQIFRVVVHPAGAVDVRFVLRAGSTASPWLRALQDDQAATAAFSAGVSASRDDRFDDAITHFETALRFTPNCVDCHFNIGVSHSRLNRFQESETAYRQALELQRNYAPAYYGLADIFTRQNRLDEAAIARQEATRITVTALAADRAQARDTLTRGINTWNTGNVSDALSLFRTALDSDATLVEAYYWLGLVYEASGDPGAAQQALVRYLGTAPDGEHAEVARERVEALVDANPDRRSPRRPQ